MENPASSVSDLVLVKDGSIVYEPSVMVEDFVLDNEDFPDTKTVLTIGNSGVTFKFANDDKLGVFPYNTTGAPQRLFTLKSSSASSCVFNGNGFALTAGTAYAAYYPFIDNANLAATSVNVSYAGQTQTTAKAPGASDASFNLGGADYLVSHASPVGNECNFKMSHIGALVVMDVTVGLSATYTELSLNSSSASFLQTGTLDLTQNINRPTDGTPTQGIAISSTYNANKMTLALGSGSGIYLTAGSQYRFCMMVPPTDLTGTTVTIRLKEDSNVEHIAYVPAKDLRQGYAYRYSCTLDAATSLYDVYGATANSYIVNIYSIDNDGYFLPTHIAGNGRAVDWAGIGFIDDENEAYPTGGGFSLSGNGVEVILNENESNQPVIQDVIFSSNRIYFKATGRRGNAKVTLTNNGTRVWTWHIWCTDTPSTYTVGSYTVMDRNLGAWDEIRYCTDQACGLYYPYGSPIGFTVGEYSNGIEGGQMWTMKQYFQHPESPYLRDKDGLYMPFNPYAASNVSAVWARIWGNGGNKTMYDPCPPGYKVAPAAFWQAVVNSSISGDPYHITVGSAMIPYNGRVYRGGIQSMSFEYTYDHSWSGTASTRQTRVFMWMSSSTGNNGYYYTIQKGTSGWSDNNSHPTGATVSSDILTRGMGVRCVSGY